MKLAKQYAGDAAAGEAASDAAGLQIAFQYSAISSA
jgi:hypothetical protein